MMSSRSRALPPLGGLRLFPGNQARALRAVAVAVAGIAAACLLLDAWLFRAHLSPDYVAFYTGPLLPRMFEMCGKAAVEELLFRLVLMSGMIALLSLVRIRPTAPLFWAVIVLAQLANVWPLVLADPLYASLRFWAVGCVWGWLYWRHGFASALLGHASVHLLLDPLLLVALHA